MHPPTMALKIKIPKEKDTDENQYPNRLPYTVLVEYAKKFKNTSEIDAELAKMLIVLQQTEREKAKHKSKDPCDSNAVKLTRFTQLFKTLLAVKASWPHVKIPHHLAAEPAF